uniref:Uncharacterized protein n=1 Tax=Plectus sambesii TaxID=2011161 RepID=A0A914XH00_9BILA
MNDSYNGLEPPWGPGLPPGRPGIDWPLRVAAAIWAPSSYPCILNLKQADQDPVNCAYPGFSAEILHLALKYAKLDYKLIPFPVVESWGEIIGEHNGTWIFDGLLGMIQNGTIDFVMSYYGMTEIRTTTLDYTFPYQLNQLQYGYVMQKQNAVNLNSATLLYAMFSWKFLEQHHGEPAEGVFSGNLIIIIIGFTCLFLHTMYEGYLVTQMFKQSSVKPFSGLTELAPLVQDGTYQLITYGMGDIYFTMLEHAQGDSFAAMRKAIQTNPPIVIPDIDKVIERIVEDPRLIYPGVSQIAIFNYMRDKCSLMFIGDEDLPELWISIPYQKNSRIGSMVSAAMAGMVDFMLYIGDKYAAYEQRGDKCAGLDDLQEGKNPLAIRHYYGLLIVGAFGFGSAFAFFLMEAAFAKWRKYKKLKETTIFVRTRKDLRKDFY